MGAIIAIIGSQFASSARARQLGEVGSFR